jgi:hypothetical protein
MARRAMALAAGSTAGMTSGAANGSMPLDRLVASGAVERGARHMPFCWRPETFFCSCICPVSGLPPATKSPPLLPLQAPNTAHDVL